MRTFFFNENLIMINNAESTDENAADDGKGEKR